ncbi:MAG: ABC transporter permease [Ilumatobacteraceae bacterium]
MTLTMLAASPPQWNGRQLSGNWDVIWYYTALHARYTVIAVTLGLVLAVPLAYVATRRRVAYPVLLAATNIIYAIPALTLFALLSPWLGYLNDKPIIVAMALYTLVILVRNIVEGIRAVPEPVIRAADGMGYRPMRRFVAVELPLALPGIVAGLRLATVSTVSLISVGAVIGRGALGKMFSDGYQRRIAVELWSAMFAVIALALLFDVVIYAAGRLATPWTRVRSARA